jgi:hypothetical protein
VLSGFTVVKNLNGASINHSFEFVNVSKVFPVNQSVQIFVFVDDLELQKISVNIGVCNTLLGINILL